MGIGTPCAAGSPAARTAAMNCRLDEYRAEARTSSGMGVAPSIARTVGYHVASNCS